MRLDVDVAGAAVTLLCKLVLIASGAVLILAVPAVSADESSYDCRLHSFLLIYFFHFHTFHGVRSGGVFFDSRQFCGGMR